MGSSGRVCKQNLPLLLLLKRRVTRRRVSGRALLRVTPVCLFSGVYFLCVVCSVLCVKLREVFPSSPASPVLTVKQSLDDE